MKTLHNSHSLPALPTVRRLQNRRGILSKSNAAEWGYVLLMTNVAYDGTTRANGPNLKTRSHWYRGPDFLRNPKIIVEIRPCHIHLTTEPCDVIALSYFSKTHVI